VLIHMLEGLRVRDVMDRAWPYRAQTSSSLSEMLAPVPSGARPVFVVLEDNRLVGIITSTDIARVLSQPGLSRLFIASDIMRTDVVIAEPDQSLYAALETCRTTGYDVLPVVTPAGDCIGVLRRQAIHEAVRSRFEELRGLLHEEHEGLTALDQDAQLYHLVLGVAGPQAETIQRLAVPADAVGRSLREADFRNRYHAQVVAVQGADGTFTCPPDVDRPLDSGELLLVIQPDSEVRETFDAPAVRPGPVGQQTMGSR
jgi:CBS domain-containing protein